MSKFRYGQTKEPENSFNECSSRFSLSFDSTPFSLAMSTISEQTGETIVWSREADDTTISGVYDDASCEVVLTAIAKRLGLQLSVVDGVFFIGTATKGDSVSTVVRIPISDRDQCVKAFEGCLSDYGKIVFLGSCVVVNDYLYNVKKVCQVVREVRERSLKGYVAELYFIRMKNSDLIDLQARLNVEGIDVFSSSLTLEKLFSMYLDCAGTSSQMAVESRPVVYLSEGRESVFEVGSELVRSRSSISSEGYSTVTGYETFTDGVRVALTPMRLSDKVISLDVDLSVSTFNDLSSGEEVPVSSKSSIKSPGLLLTDGGVYFVGSLRSVKKETGVGVFTFNRSESDEILTVWVKIREVLYNAS